MNKLFYSKLAIQNIKKNGKFYIPYILTCIGTVAGFYIMCAITNNDGIYSMQGADSLKMILVLGCVVIGIFSTIFIFYTNNFLMKRRKKEIGLYNILGMEKKHISKILFWETVFIGLLGIVLGLASGILLDKLVSMILLKILDFEVPLGFYISKTGIIATLILFVGIFLLNMLSNLVKIKLAKPIELLHGSNVGEKEPKTRWLITILGVICLAGGYYIAIVTESPLQALFLFFIAVLLVIIGTYCLFTACSIAILKMLRKNKRFYYQTKHFISVSGMIYRMKQNAVGLANICILSTMVLVMISTTVSLYAGLGDAIRSLYPANINVSVRYSDEEFDQEEIRAKITEAISSQGRSITNIFDFDYLSFTVGRIDDQLILDHNNPNGAEASIMYFITAEEYQRLTGEQVQLASNEVLLHSNKKTFGDSFSMLDWNYKVVKYLDEFPNVIADNSMLMPCHYVVVSDSLVINEIYEGQLEAYGNNASDMQYELFIDIDGTKEEETDCVNAIRVEDIKANYESLRIDGREENSSYIYAFYGGFLFLGIFLGTMFLMATVLIIYYKQISEGYEDKERFKIMQKVGLSHREVKSSINSQVLMVFFLPIVTAVIHVMFAFKLITRLLALLHLTDTMLFFQSTVVTIVVFAMIYGLVYVLTSKVYYKIVR